MNEAPDGLNTTTAELKWRFIPSPTEIICLVVGGFFVVWYSWLMDDAYVYFRYVDNLVIHGQGLVWNPNEQVEGFSSPAWALLLIVLHLTHLDYWVVVRGMGVLCFFVFWWLACLVNRGLTATSNGRIKSLNLPLIYLCCTYGVACYFTSGLESPLIIVAAVAYAAAVMWPQSRVLQSLIGLSPLVRPELLVPYFLFLAYAFLFKKCKAYVALATCVASCGGYGLFRVWYYADFFPNTFYLKDISWVSQGLLYVYDTIVPYQTIPFFLGMFVVYLALGTSRQVDVRSRERVAMIVLAIPVAVYVVKIGGDPRHFRYLAFPFVLMVSATGGLTEDFVDKFTSLNGRWPTVLAVVFGMAVVSQYPRQLQQHPMLRSVGYSHQSFLQINDAAFHRFHAKGVSPDSFAIHSFLSYAEAQRRYAAEESTKTVSQLRTDDTSDPSSASHAEATATARIIETLWCQDAYLHPAVPVVHSLGLTDPFLARTRMTSDRAGHKLGLIPLAKDITRIRSRYGFTAGAFDRSIADGLDTPAWITHNLDTLRSLERKAYHQGNFLENLRLALTPVGQIDPEMTEK